MYWVERPYPFADLATHWQLANQKDRIPLDIVNQWTAIDCMDVSWKENLGRVPIWIMRVKTD